MVKIGLLGAGFAAEFHIQALREVADADVVAVASRSRSEVFARKWGVKKHYGGPDFMDKLCRDPDVEAVDIVLPNFLHVDAVTLSAENNKNIIVEKPLGRNAIEAERMVSMVRAHGVLHAYAENQLYTPHILRVREFLSSGAIGDVFHVRSREAHFGPHSEWFWNRDLAGGGALLDMGCHSIEVARKLIGRDPKEVFAWTATLVHGQKTSAEDESLTLVKYDGGALGQSENSWTAHGGLDIRFEVYGKEGSVFVDVTRGTGINVFSVAPEHKVGYIVEKAEVSRGWMIPTWREYDTFGYLGELRHFVDSFKRDVMPQENFVDGLAVNRIIDAAYRSAKTGKWEPINT